MAEPFTAELTQGGQVFPFDLHQRVLDLGPAGPVPYYWMDGRGFRDRQPGRNFRSVVDHWWRAAEREGDRDDHDAQASLVLAEAYPLVARAKGLQAVYVDAHLHPRADREPSPTGRGQPRGRAERMYVLPAEEVARLRELAHARDAPGVRAELDELFHGPPPSAEELPAFQEAAHRWAYNGAAAFRDGGRAGVHAYVRAELGPWMKRFRKLGGADRLHDFLNHFAYECKMAFYACYAGAWVGLVPWLAEHRGLEAAGERLLRLWHAQGEAMRGQVLALHPLSGVVHAEPRHLQAIGAWVGHAEYEVLEARGASGSCPAYWDLVAAVLVAAHEYKHGLVQWKRTRGVGPVAGGSAAAYAARDDAPVRVALTLEDYAAERGLACAGCGGDLEYAEHGPPGAGSAGRESATVAVIYRCRTCGTAATHRVGVADLKPLI